MCESWVSPNSSCRRFPCTGNRDEFPSPQQASAQELIPPSCVIVRRKSPVSVPVPTVEKRIVTMCGLSWNQFRVMADGKLQFSKLKISMKEGLLFFVSG